MFFLPALACLQGLGGFIIHRNLCFEAGVSPPEPDNAIIFAPVELFPCDIKRKPVAVSQEILLPDYFFFQKNEIPFLFHGQLRIPPSIAVYHYPALRLAAGIVYPDLVTFQEKLYLLFFLNFQQEFLYLLFPPLPACQPSVNTIKSPVRPLENMGKIRRKKQIYSLPPIGPGKVGKVKQIFNIP
ncbi:hypothetical protein IMSAGC019_02373 [Lachnospiraceae bacterium]|nr:hypothetical protein IMSAGC019_02373 [Lachnospiraceae bacterium]